MIDLGGFSLIGTLYKLFTYVLWGIFLYYFIVSMFGWVKRKEISANNFPIENRFAILVAAHNEEAVISGIIYSLQHLSYPKDMYDIYVIADNCTDKTASIARENGAKVYERFDNVKKGKGYSLEWMFRKLFEMEKQYDAICIFDADNLVSSNFLLEMNKQLCQGHKVIQGYLDSKNPEDSWISGNYSLAYWISNRIFQLSRHYLGLSCALGGTGFVMATQVLKEIGWGATCLTEDLEFSLKLVLKGMKVSWAHEAVIYDEKPLKLKQSWRQRKRWMQGHCDCAVRYFKDLMKKAFRDKDMVAFDIALYLIYPFVIVFNGIAFMIDIIKKLFIFAQNPVLSSIFAIPKEIPFWVFGMLMLFLTYYNIVFVILEKKLTMKIFLYFLLVPIYSLTWIPIIIQGFLDRNKKEWSHTAHSRVLDMDEIERLEKVG